MKALIGLSLAKWIRSWSILSVNYETRLSSSVMHWSLDYNTTSICFSLNSACYSYCWLS